MVRHLQPTSSWHPTTDRLQGTVTYGTPGYDVNAWSVQFGSFNEFLFASGDKSNWLIATRAAVIGQSYQNAWRDIVKSSTSASAYQARWYNRDGSLEDPWISLTDHDTAISNGQLLYGGNSFGSTHASYISVQGGMNVFVRSTA